jgi:hypothetical protein
MSGEKMHAAAAAAAAAAAQLRIGIFNKKQKVH